jgi:UDP-N-acetyl-D-glucosamine dehydrogenase
VTRVEGSRSDLDKADAIVLLVDHDEFDVAALEEVDGYVLDCRRMTTGSNVERL